MRLFQWFVVGIAALIVNAVVPTFFPAWGDILSKIIPCQADDFACIRLYSSGIIVVVFLMAIGVEFLLKKWRDKHGLEIFYTNDDEWCHHFNANSVDGKDAYFTRLKVINNSKAVANCYGYLRAIRDKDGSSKNLRWDKSDLGWQQQTDDEVGKPVAIGANGDYKYLDIVWVNKGEDVFKIRAKQLSQGVEPHRPRGQYYFRIVISDDKLGALKQWFMVRWCGDYTDFKMKKVHGVEIAFPYLRHRLDRYKFPPSPSHV